MTDETSQPLVSCIMPTYNRREFVPRAIRYFMRQDYANNELIIIDDGTDAIKDLVPDDSRIRYLRLDKKRTIGGKRNMACKEAAGEIIVHWDDDDWMATYRIIYQVENLLREQADICGLDKLYFYDPLSQKAWRYVYPEGSKPWLAGGTLCYKKAFWSRNPFPDLNVGEDACFVWTNCSKKMLTLQNYSFYVAIIHLGNTSIKRTSDSRWHNCPTSKIQKIMCNDWKCYANLSQGEQKRGADGQKIPEKHREALIKFPLVSCILPTYNRKHLFSQAIKYFMQQDYPNRELIVVDDGTEPVADLLPKNPSINYIRLPRKHILGAKRNIACEAAKGEIVIFWDDDDWYAPNRISYQVEPLLRGALGVTGLGKGLLLSLSTGEFWTTTSRLHERMFFQGIISGTIAFWKRLWNEGVRFPNISLADDVAFLKALVRRGVYLEKLDNNGIFVYVRHDTNTWRFETGTFLETSGWKRGVRPSFMSKEDLEFYGIDSQTHSTEQKTSLIRSKTNRKPDEENPLVSCILATSNRRPFLKQAIKYFSRQTYENRELVIVDDGPGSYEAFLPDDVKIRYVKLAAPTLLGMKLNIGIKASHGEIIQKLDDDDYYHPDFLKTTVCALLTHKSKDAIVGFDCFLVLIAATQELKFSGYGWCAGGTLCFFKQLWEKTPFRDVKKAVDWWFLKDHAPKRIKIRNVELYILLRHDSGHLWTSMGKLDVNEYFHRQANYSKTLRDILPEEDLQFYENLSKVATKQKVPQHETYITAEQPEQKVEHIFLRS